MGGGMTGLLCRTALLLALGSLATGCITTAEQQAKRNNERCADRGLQPNSDAFADCIVRLETERDARMEARRREMVEKSAIPPSNRGY
jgi:hypothetical protein